VYDEAKRFAEAMTVRLPPVSRPRRQDRPDLQHLRTAHARQGRESGAGVHLAGAAERGRHGLRRRRQTRSFTYITDLVDGIIRLMLSSVNEPVNIGNPREMTLEELATRIIDMTGSKSRIVYRPLPVDDPKVRQPDITKARTLLEWEPRVPVEEGLATTIEYFRTKLQDS
jgi:dTDP-glucose 4,6-dehydratase